jgi:hypothetical protein
LAKEKRANPYLHINNKKMIQHTLELTENGYRLVIWEPAPKTAARISPFIFRATYLLNSPSKAIEILKMVKGENESIISQAKHNAMDEPTAQDLRKSSTDRLPATFPVNY